MRSADIHTIGEAFQKQAKLSFHRTALFYLGTGYTYETICRWTLSFAHSLADAGIQPGDRVILYLPNSPQWAVAWLGILTLGASAVPITPIYTPHDLKYIADDSGAKAIVCTDVNYGYVEQVLSETQIGTVIHTNVTDLLPIWKRAFGALFNRVPSGKVGKKSDALSFRKFLSSPPKLPLAPTSTGEEMAILLYTGGTTKSPKGVPISHRQFLEVSWVHFKAHEELIPWGENVILQGAPLFHILGQVFGMGPLLICGDALILLPRMNLDGIMDAIQRHGAKTLLGVPALYRMILDHERLDLYDLGSLIYCMCGGDVLPNEVARRWRERIGVSISNGYGATETVGGISMSPPGREHPSQAMGLVLPNKEVRIVDPESLSEVPLGRPGEILVRSEPMVTHYWNKPEETSEAFVELDGKLWYRTADVVSMDQEGYLYFVDRTVDTIKHKGYRVSASEIEAVLQEHPAVVGSCVVGIPDPKVGSRIKAYVVLKEDIKGMTGYDLIRWCRDKLVSYKVPHYIEFRDMLPKSKVGKLLRREMRREEKRRLEKGKWDETLGDHT
ncbi:MAG: AMP-binding protein [Deltaproteobacteria bacterium]|nr:MAG: AMP-binding protein [Deltaproteobacteria bacterium]